ncbi:MULTISPECIES: glycosyltransferase [Paraburkholderia]|uniref:Glycosyltransferase n=1 Tax=Paraburkholderia madseniana TaxID=2599607 RepID=A0AAP5BIG5_9BURK|nr:MULTISPECIES: glycosyltransferase [Paraburkholderia]MCX4149285.1 glycosyltransferase [Paraburkholderia madseniana]MDN7152220.1 glycosyltransferase [Paraburkholderia sp. WS6]MDQ6411102.1 glycosyltransferase [Paraburkholderia madseniana]
MMIVHWVLGPKNSKTTGVGLYSEMLCDSLSSNAHEVCRYYFSGKVRSVRRYFDQILGIPLRLFCSVRRDDTVVLYQEDIAFMSWVAALRTNKVIVIVHHLPILVEHPNLIDKIKNIVIRANLLALRSGSKVVCPSENTAKLFKKTYRSSLPHVVPNAFKINCVERDSNDRVEARNLLAKNLRLSLNGKFLILAVGSEESRKNFDVLIKGLASASVAKRVFFLKLGRPIDLRNRSVNLQLSEGGGFDFAFVDEVTDDILRLAYSSADLFVTSSLLEGFGRTPIEAQSYGAPICASKIDIFDETMGNTYYPVESPERPESWAAAVERLESDSKLRFDLSMMGSENSRRYDISRVGLDFLGVISGLE